MDLARTSFENATTIGAILNVLWVNAAPIHQATRPRLTSEPTNITASIDGAATGPPMCRRRAAE